MSQPAPEPLQEQGPRPEWERDENDEVPPAEALPSEPTGETFEEWLSKQAPPRAEPDFQPRPIEPPYRRRLAFPYVSRTPYKPNPKGLSPRELDALEEFFRTRAVKTKKPKEIPMNAKRDKSSSEPEPEPQPEPNQRLADLEAEIAERTAEAVAAAKRSDSGIRAANAHLAPEDVS